MALTLQEAQAELATIKVAINEYYTGTRRRTFKVGSHEFERTYNFENPADLLKTLLEERQKLESYISSIDVTSLPVFASYMTIPLLVKSH